MLYHKVDIYKLKQNKSYDDIYRLKLYPYSPLVQQNISFFQQLQKLKLKYPLSYQYLFPTILNKKLRLKSIVEFLNATRK